RGRAGRWRIWSAAAASGEEPYSIAITLAETFVGCAPPVEILATDLDTAVLAHAQRAEYARERVQKLDPQRIRRHLLPVAGGAPDLLRVRDELRALVRFRQINLLDAQWPVQGPFDAIFCRNVLIYFERATQRRIVERFLPLLAPD